MRNKVLLSIVSMLMHKSSNEKVEFRLKMLLMTNSLMAVGRMECNCNNVSCIMFECFGFPLQK